MVARSIFVMRHGQTDWNVQGRMQGHTDVPLNALGVQQARDAAARVVDLGIGAVISSDLSRALETARAVATHLSVPLHTDVELRERCFGIFEGLTWAEIGERHPELHAAWHADRFHPIPGAETLEALRTRASRALLRASERAPDGRNVLVVTHGGVVRSLMSLVPGGGLEGPVVNAGCYCFDVEEERFLCVRPV